MREVEVPPLSATVEQFRREVGRRAAGRARRRQAVAGGAVAAVLLSGALTWAGLSTAGPTGGEAHPSAASPSPTTTTGPSAASTYPSNGAQRVGGTPATIPSPVPPWSQAGARTFTHPPSGSTLRVAAGTPIVVALAPPPTGGWGMATVDRGAGSVLDDVVPQSVDAVGNARIYLKALRPGVARLEVPSLGNPAASWHGTVVVTAPAHR